MAISSRSRRTLRAAGPGDLYAEVHQSASDKLLGSVTYPFTVFERKQDFPGCPNLAMARVGAFYQYTLKESTQLLTNAVKGAAPTKAINDQVYSFGGSIIEQAKKVLDAANTAGQKYKGPNKKQLQAIVEGGIPNLVHTLSDWGLYAWCPYLRVVARTEPSLTLASPRIDLTNVKINVTATGELWAKYPWWNCYEFCTSWKKVIKCDKIGSITVSPDIKAAAHANIEASGSIVTARGVFDLLRLDYPILDKIPLEGIANDALGSKLVYVYDASQLVETVPVLKSRFTVGTITLPGTSGGISVGITLRQL
jgi:hypothetical protein